ncbi:SEC12-like protein 1 [Selaginella moellendorffii]|uniref:SEC12-like protein 1 n=1 Tax=Selaginella moellendorffii TaxID=88036 RepID=UPI000D1D0573|nr:SEC12-like protein 1 [Selaginella moellendorffii]|eukprot:XP_024514903.1 SEC12-like protein 1 [Selaginella moellendorffii]
MAPRRRYLGVCSSTTGSATCAGWAASRSIDRDALLLIAKTDGGHGRLELAKYSFDEKLLQDEACVLPCQAAPQALAFHPSGDGALCSFAASCRFVQVEQGSLSWSPDMDPQRFHGFGEQNKICFSADGSRVAFGGKDGRLRVLDWPGLTTLIDEPKAHKSIKDLDFSLDGALLASTSEDGPCRIWDLDKAMPLTSLHREKAESFGFCRFSRNGSHPFLFVAAFRDGKGYVAVWEIAKWSRLGSKKFLDCEISALATSCDGKRLALGGMDGAVSVIEVKSMQKRQYVERADTCGITLLEMSPNSRALLSVSADGNVRVTATNVPGPWKDWQVYLLLAGLIAMSAALFYIFFELSDSFWRFPLGRNQPARPSMRAIYGSSVDTSMAEG